MVEKQFVILGICALFIFLGYSGCLEEVNSFTCDDRFSGIWESRGSYGRTIIFYPDGTWNSAESEGSWNVEGDVLFITSAEMKITYIYEYIFYNADSLKLTSSNGVSITYRRS